MGYNVIEVRIMPDYKEMYFKLFRETYKAVLILMDAQRMCEDMYINAEEPELLVLSMLDENEKEQPEQDGAETDLEKQDPV